MLVGSEVQEVFLDGGGLGIFMTGFATRGDDDDDDDNDVVVSERALSGSADCGSCARFRLLGGLSPRDRGSSGRLPVRELMGEWSAGKGAQGTEEDGNEGKRG